MNASSDSHFEHIDEQAARWTALLEGGEMSCAQHEELEAWLAADESHLRCFSRYQFVSLDAGEKTLALHARRRCVKTGRAASVGERIGRVLVDCTRRTWSLPAAVAAVAIITVVTLAWAPRGSSEDKLVTAAAQRRAWTLADGTRANLNARTHVSADFRPDIRRVRMESGEAMFSVEKDPSRPFVVETPAGNVRVTGTVFNVRLEPSGALEVTVLEGSVTVDAGAVLRPQGESFQLLPHEQLTVGPAESRVRTLAAADLEHVMAWKEGRIVFDGVPLATAVARLAEFHQRKITVSPEIAGLRLGGSYTLENLHGIFGAMEDALPVRVESARDGTFRVTPRVAQRPN